MVSVVIDDQDTILFPKYLEAALCTMEVTQGHCDFVKRNARFQADDNGSHCIVNIVSARHGQLHHTEFPVALIHSEGDAAVPQIDLVSRIVTARFDAVRNDFALNLRQQFPDVSVVAANHRFSIRLDLVQELHVGFLQLAEIPAVVLQVIRLDVGHHAKRRVVLQEGAVAFVSLRNHAFSLPGFRIGAHVHNFPTDNVGRVCPAMLHHECDHRRGRCFPMGPGHGDTGPFI
ncbi:hypothetical protein D3C74_300800 [compost metagenome]